MKPLEYFPGANTPQGFYSYYDYILHPAETKNKIILKGGPGTGKSSLMKKVASLLTENGLQVNLLHCSSDPDSLDAIVAPSLGFCMLDGTAPHIVDPICPGASDTIINLGDFWNAGGIRKHKAEIQKTNTAIKENFNSAYNYLRAAKEVQMHIHKTNAAFTEAEQIDKTLNHVMSNLNIRPNFCAKGKITKGFLTGFTPKGSISYIDSFAASADRVFCVLENTDTSAYFLNRLAECIISSGKDAWLFYCPLHPDRKTEHIYLPNENIFITTANAYHSCSINTEQIDLTPYTKADAVLRADTDIFNILLSRATALIQNAKSLHDKLEQFYIPYMNFDAVEKLPQKIVNEIL